MLFFIWDLEGRWFYIVVMALVSCAAVMILVKFFQDFLFILLFFSVPIAGFIKWLTVEGYSARVGGVIVYSGTLGIGFVDFILIALYINWFYRIFITKTAAAPRIEGIDYWILLLILAYTISLIGVEYLNMGIYAVMFLIKHVMIYLYVSRHLLRRHIPWLIGALFTAILIETIIGLFQNQTGLLRGIALDKGAGGQALDYQYAVPGIESMTRATGTTYDSHSLGLYISMLITYAFVLIFAPLDIWRRRSSSYIFFILGLVVLVLTFSRSAWVSTFFSLSFILAVYLYRREPRAWNVVRLLLVMSIFAAPLGIGMIIMRLESAPIEIMTTRFEQFPVALSIWRDHILFGSGVGNYFHNVYVYNFNWALELPVHNVFLWIGAETGVLGVIAFFGLIAVAFRRCWKLFKSDSGLAGRLALAICASLIAYIVDGLGEPLFREPVPYMMFWISIALSVALPRIHKQKKTILNSSGAIENG